MEQKMALLHANTCQTRVLLENVRRCWSCQQKNINNSTLRYPAHISLTSDFLFSSSWAHLGQCVLERKWNENLRNLSLTYNTRLYVSLFC